MAIQFNPSSDINPTFRQTGIDAKFISALKTFKEEGNLVYEYNPLRNLRLKYDLYRQDDLGRLVDNTSTPITFTYNGSTITLTSNNIYNLIETNAFELTDVEILNADTITEALQNRLGLNLQILARSGTLVDFESNKLDFNLNNPISIECQPSYDGSVNLILNDDLNSPKLINSRFIPLEGNTYKVANRKGNNDTNIYDDYSFDVDTSLYKRITTIPELSFIGLRSGGNMLCGNYNFYFKYADSDGNETDFVAESGSVVCYIGNINNPDSIRGGMRNENSNKMIHFQLSNIDSSYEYVVVYYTRNTSDLDGQLLTTAGKFDKNFNVNSKGTCEVILTGFENIEPKTIEDINVQYNIVDAAKTQAQVQNMLFMGNVHKPEIPYEELQDLSLRIYPTAYMDTQNPIGFVENDYTDKLNGEFEYYNPKNIYDKLSYWDGEIYRFGIVYILNDYTVSPVFDIRGRNNVGIYKNEEENFNEDFYSAFPVYTDQINPITGEKTRNYIEIEEDYTIGSHDLENAKGVVRFTLADEDNYIINTNSVTPLGVRFYMPDDVITELRKHCKGYFIVRQKRIPTVLAQALTIGLDKNAYVPLIPVADNDSEPTYITERFIKDDLSLNPYFKEHLYKQPSSQVDIKAAICPEAELRFSLFTQLFTGSPFSISESKVQPASNKFFSDNTLEGRSFYIQAYTTQNTSAGEIIEDVKLTLVQDNIEIKTSGTQKFAARAGQGEDAWKFSYLYKDNNSPAMIRGSWGTYVGMENYNIPMRLINIHIPGYNLSLLNEYFNIRYNDVSPYFPVTQRIAIENLEENVITIEESGGTLSKYRTITTYGGDCYVCTYTHRIMRNFQDPELPTNDTIVEINTFKDNYSATDATKNASINRSDVNAVKLGHWVTFKCLSNINLNLRDVDDSFYTEQGLTGSPRSFHPLQTKSVDGVTKVPESNIINGGISSTISSKYNFLLPDVPYIKNEFDNRIMYSDIHVNDAFKNGYRIFRSTNFRDFTKEFGAITKIESWFGNLICILEHGVILIPINERIIAGEGPGGSAFINTLNVLPENPKILNSNFGSGWAESIITSENWLYGIDTVAKKIWRTNGENFEVISDFKIQKFLNDNITLRERELTPTIGIRNVKSHYNAFKKDIMFTFYDDLYGEEENVWNICFNEILNKWITFYSWVPSDSENIDNIFFSFDRTTSKWISKLGVSNAQSTNADGISLSNVIFERDKGTYIGDLTVLNRNFPILEGRSGVCLTYELLEDPFGNYKNFRIVTPNESVQVGWSGGNPRYENRPNGGRLHYIGDYNDFLYYETRTDGDIIKHGKKVYMLSIKVNIEYIQYKAIDNDVKQYTNGFKTYAEINGGYFTNTVAVTPYDNISKFTQENESETFYPGLTTDFWKHGQAGLIDIQDTILPTKWYGKVHPFEFEFIVADEPSVQKIFNNLYIISNKTAPESFHFEVVGEGYTFSSDKKNMYYRQELTKEMFQEQLNLDVIYNRHFRDISNLTPKIKSNLLPLYYNRVSSFDEIYDSYQRMTSVGRDYQNLTGGEIIWDRLTNDFKVNTHQKGNDINKVGRLRGNMQYKEDIWNVEIKPINFVEKNENITNDWRKDIPIIVSQIPEYFDTNNPNNYPYLESPYNPSTNILDESHTVSLLKDSTWTNRKETKLRDKYIRIKVRYSGDDLAIITALRTIFIQSYA